MTAAEYIRKAKKASRQRRGMSDEEFEMFFWENLHLPSPLYGCDVKGSLFDAADPYPWNLRRLGTCLQDGLGRTTLDGINTPYLYFGNFRSMFAWHVEDLNLGSINFQHFGAPKYWYGISKKHFRRFESFAKAKFQERNLECNQFLRHKTILINPYLIREEMPDIPIYKHIQRPGEFIITLTNGYHTGFNAGFNTNEAVNFAPDNWLEIFPKQKVRLTSSASASATTSASTTSGSTRTSCRVSLTRRHRLFIKPLFQGNGAACGSEVPRRGRGDKEGGQRGTA